MNSWKSRRLNRKKIRKRDDAVEPKPFQAVVQILLVITNAKMVQISMEDGSQ